MVGEDAWYDFNFLKFIEVWFVTQYVVYPGECSMYTWEECVFCWFGMGWSMYVLSLHDLIPFESNVSTLIFCLDDHWYLFSGVPNLVGVKSASLE